MLLFFAQGTQPAARLVTGELVAVEIVRMLVGSIGLVLSVPVTTRLAAAVLSRMDEDELPDDGGHTHGHIDDFDDLRDDLRDDFRDPRDPQDHPVAAGADDPWF